MGKNSKSNPKNHYVNKQKLTWSEHVLDDGNVAVIPDADDAYGDENSVAAMAEDYVGLKTDSDEAAKAAGETAREQFNQDTRDRLAAIASQQYWSRYAAAGMQFVNDNEGRILGVKILLRKFDTDSEHSEMVEQFVAIDDIHRAAEALGKQAS